MSALGGHRLVIRHNNQQIVGGSNTSQELQRVIIKIYCIQKFLLDLDPIKFYAYQLIFIITLVIT